MAIGIIIHSIEDLFVKLHKNILYKKHCMECHGTECRNLIIVVLNVVIVMSLCWGS